MPSTLIQTPVFRPEVDVEVAFDVMEERSTIIHCTLSITCLLRISPNTFLVQPNGHRKKLLHAYNIASYPNWGIALPDHCFTLIFEGLDKDCAVFDLFEDIKELYPFHFRDISRNRSDVYWLGYPNFPLE